MASEQSRLECLRLASERLGPGASMEDLWAEAKRLLAFVDGYDTIHRQPDGSYVVGKPV